MRDVEEITVELRKNAMEGKYWPGGREHLKDWAEGKPFGLFLLGTEAVRAASACHDLLEQNRLKRGPIWRLPRIDDATWFGFYVSRRRLRRGLLEAFGASPEEAVGLDAIYAGICWWSNADRESVRKSISEAMDTFSPNELRKAAQEFWRGLLEAVNEIELLNDRITEREIVCHPAMVFFLQVATPIWLRHGKWPSTLFRRATRTSTPDFEGLDRLVRNDRRVREHPLIKRARMLRGVGHKYRQVIELASARRPQKVAISTLKTRTAGLLSAFAQRFDFPLHEPHIRDLFNRESQWASQADDVDLPPGQWACSKAIQRGRKHWSLPPVPNEESLKSVRALWRVAS